jgi:excisionase family DNA binding protein
MAEHTELAAKTSANSIRVPTLSTAAAAFVRQYPNQAELAVRAALEAAAAQFDWLNRHDSGIPDSLRPYVSKPSSPIPLVGVIGAEEAARRLNVSRATVYNWVEAGRLIGWRLTRQGIQIPAEQIVGPGELVAGIEHILRLIPEPRAAWRFLDEESQHFESPLRPIDALKAGRVEEVVNATRASGESFA